MTTHTYQHNFVEIVVHRPTLDDKEREKREAALLQAVTAYGKAAMAQEVRLGNVRANAGRLFGVDEADS